MIHRFVCIASVFGVFFIAQSATQSAVADDYVWTRTMWGSSNVNGHYSSMSNGYGGYYVPRNRYGNDFEARGNFTNPQGYIVPANAPSAPPVAQPAFFGHRRRQRWQ